MYKSLTTFRALPRKLSAAQRYGGTITHYKAQTDMGRMNDALFVLAHQFVGTNSKADVGKFIHAYVHCETITKPQGGTADSTNDDIHTGDFRKMLLVSSRTASKARDYIFSTMPQFEWYDPPKNAKYMTFNEIFLDLYRQTKDTKHGFAYRILRFLTDPKSVHNVEEAWLPSLQQPEPRCLGDFLKLLGQRFAGKHSLDADDLHSTSPVMVVENIDDHYQQVLDVIEKSMKLSRQRWEESHKGGELSRYGNFPDPSWEHDSLDALMMGWSPVNNGYGLRQVTDGDDTFLVSGFGWEFNEYDQPLSALSTAEEWAKRSDEGTLLQRAINILDHMWCAHHRDARGSQASDWEGFKMEMRPQWSRPLLRTMLLITGMIGCGIGLSAGRWANTYFVPVYIRVKDFMTVGLLARHA